jgi:hypothetical protein
VNARIFMRVLAVYYVLALGAVWLVAPRSGLGHDHSADAVFVARALGADLAIKGCRLVAMARRIGARCAGAGAGQGGRLAAARRARRCA